MSKYWFRSWKNYFVAAVQGNPSEICFFLQWKKLRIVFGEQRKSPECSSTADPKTQNNNTNIANKFLASLNNTARENLMMFLNSAPSDELIKRIKSIDKKVSEDDLANPNLNLKKEVSVPAEEKSLSKYGCQENVTVIDKKDDRSPTIE